MADDYEHKTASTGPPQLSPAEAKQKRKEMLARMATVEEQDEPASDSADTSLVTLFLPGGD